MRGSEVGHAIETLGKSLIMLRNYHPIMASYITDAQGLRYGSLFAATDVNRLSQKTFDPLPSFPKGLDTFETIVLA